MNYTRQKVEISTEVINDPIIIKPDQGDNSKAIDKVLPLAILVLLGIWLGLSVVNNGQFLTEIILSSMVIGSLLFIKAICHPKHIRENVQSQHSI